MNLSPFQIHNALWDAMRSQKAGSIRIPIGRRHLLVSVTKTTSQYFARCIIDSRKYQTQNIHKDSEPTQEMLDSGYPQQGLEITWIGPPQGSFDEVVLSRDREGIRETVHAKLGSFVRPLDKYFDHADAGRTTRSEGER